ncbi:hypothetical protein FB567DRAFT_544505 [Paraphoma chrysanthemicola]|uniref:Uncharacterized protein n=1 Tax=Paraphoma chrysanthemicola TaxID=798071 RepID=A0A8K0REG9_9PLEO|nr:hypothetical protein FB567DRAFT_544505 [Paraphoma chrysanthemicola]
MRNTSFTDENRELRDPLARLKRKLTIVTTERDTAAKDRDVWRQEVYDCHERYDELVREKDNDRDSNADYRAVVADLSSAIRNRKSTDKLNSKLDATGQDLAVIKDHILQMINAINELNKGVAETVPKMATSNDVLALRTSLSSLARTDDVKKILECLPTLATSASMDRVSDLIFHKLSTLASSREVIAIRTAMPTLATGDALKELGQIFTTSNVQLTKANTTLALAAKKQTETIADGERATNFAMAQYVAVPEDNPAVHRHSQPGAISMPLMTPRSTNSSALLVT